MPVDDGARLKNRSLPIPLALYETQTVSSHRIVATPRVAKAACMLYTRAVWVGDELKW
jgi:hypothetical protein